MSAINRFCFVRAQSRPHLAGQGPAERPVRYSESQYLQVDDVLDDGRAVEHAEHVLHRLHRHAVDRFPRGAGHVRRSGHFVALAHREFGSGRSSTGRPAAAMTPDVRAACKSFSSTMPPRAVLTRYAVGFMRFKRAASNMPTVSSVLGQWMVTKSARGSAKSRSATGSQPA